MIASGAAIGAQRWSSTPWRKIPLGLLKQWVEQWKLLAYRGMEPLVELFGRALHPQEPHDDSAKVRGADDTFLARCGPEASQT